MTDATGTAAQYLTLTQLIAQTGFSSATIHRWKRKGLIPYFQPAGKGGHIRFPVNAIEACRRVGSDILGDFTTPESCALSATEPPNSSKSSEANPKEPAANLKRRGPRPLWLNSADKATL